MTPCFTGTTAEKPEKITCIKKPEWFVNEKEKKKKINKKKINKMAQRRHLFFFIVFVFFVSPQKAHAAGKREQINWKIAFMCFEFGAFKTISKRKRKM